MIEAYVYSSCSSCRKTLDELRASGTTFRTRDYFKDRFSRDELKQLLDRVGLASAILLSTRSRVYRERELDAEALDADEVLDLMVEEPTLLRRPIIVNGEKVVVGHNPRKLAELIAS